MADHQHKNFTAKDIEMYHNGQLTPAEMHAMEKAALDDPMLADALEGFSLIESTAIEPGMHDLQERLTQRISQNEKRKTPVILFYKKNWFRVAAMFVLFAGLGFMIYQFSFNQKEKDIAATEKTEEADIIKTDTNSTAIVIPKKTDSIPVVKKQQDIAAAKKTTSAPTETPVETTIPNDLDNQVAGLEIQSKREETEIVAQAKQAEMERAIKSEDARIAADQNAFTKNAQAKMARPSAAAPLSSKPINALSGRITDEKNNPVPYAVIRNKQQNLIVSADSAGKFTMLTSDTALAVEISSIGYENSTFSLQEKKANDIVLKESTAALSEVVVTGYGSTKKRALNNAPEPIIGWEKYFQYLDENQIKTGLLSPGQQKGIVELSFTINKKGQPGNIKMLNTDCVPCSADAIRLVKDGPGWKLNGRNNKVKLQVAFTSK